MTNRWLESNRPSHSFANDRHDPRPGNYQRNNLTPQRPRSALSFFRPAISRGLKDVDGLRPLPGAPGQQRCLRRMCQAVSWAWARLAADRALAGSWLRPTRSVNCLRSVRRRRRRRRSRSRPVSLPGPFRHCVNEGLVRLSVLVGRHQAGLPVRFRGERFCDDVGDPDLNRPQAWAQPRPVCPLERSAAPAKLQPVNHQQ